MKKLVSLSKVVLLLTIGCIVSGICIEAIYGHINLAKNLILYGLLTLLIGTFLFLSMMILFPNSKKYFI